MDLLVTAGLASLLTLLILALISVVAWLLLQRALRKRRPAFTSVELGADEVTTLRGMDGDDEAYRREQAWCDERCIALAGPAGDPSPRQCATCKHFNLEAGQRIIAAQPAFFAATAHLEPWQMARQRKVIPNPEYEKLEERFLAAQKAGDAQRSRELHDQLLEMDPGTLEDDTDDVSYAMLDTTWTQLGACGKHKELRAAHDACEEWASKIVPIDRLQQGVRWGQAR